MAVNCRLSPLASDGDAGVTPIETSVAAVTVSVVERSRRLNVAEVVVTPTFAAEARPCEPAALLMLAVSVSLDAQVALVVRFCVLASVYVPVAVNC